MAAGGSLCRWSFRDRFTGSFPSGVHLSETLQIPSHASSRAVPPVAARLLFICGAEQAERGSGIRNLFQALTRHEPLPVTRTDTHAEYTSTPRKQVRDPFTRSRFVFVSSRRTDQGAKRRRSGNGKDPCRNVPTTGNVRSRIRKNSDQPGA